MPVNDELGLRMKNYYENIPKTKLIRRMPVAIRIDGKAFHTFTRGFKKPFDEVLMKTMQETMKYLCENIQGCVLGYTQSDEITLILVDYQKLDTSAWFDYEVQKICSISASMATMAFNKFFERNVKTYWNQNICPKIHMFSISKELHNYMLINQAYSFALQKGAMFDARCFNIPKEEVANLLYWRQLDAARNSIQMVGQTYFSQKELHKKTCNDIQDMLLLQKSINWNNFPIEQKRGSCCIKKLIQDEKTAWIIDTDIPIFKGENRRYIEERIFVGE